MHVRTNSEEIGNVWKDWTWGFEFTVMHINLPRYQFFYWGQWVWGYSWNNTLCNQDTDCHLEWMTWTFFQALRGHSLLSTSKTCQVQAFTEVYQCLCPKMAPCQSYVPSHILRRTCEKWQPIQLQNMMDLRLTSSKLLFFLLFLKLGLEKWTSSKDWKKTTRQVPIHMPCGLISVLVLVNILFFSFSPAHVSVSNSRI